MSSSICSGSTSASLRAFFDGPSVLSSSARGAGAQVIDRHDRFIALVDSISQGCRSRLIDDPKDLKSRQMARVFSGLSLRIVEISRDSDHRLSHFFAEESRRALLQIAKYKR